jgi:putative nucleotidyltransferase with HDIG domain
MAKDFEEFKTRLLDLGSLPSVPTILTELLRCIRDESTTTDEISHLVGQDAGLTARLLKLANSSAMGVRVQVTSITRAVALLGRSQVAQICLGDGVWSSLKPLATKARFNLDAFELHSLVGAEAAQELARRSKAVDADEIYAAALLHDIGKFLLLAIDREVYADTLLEAKATGRDLEVLEADRLGWTHSQIGGWLAQEWGLPPVIHEVAAWHHHPSEVLEQPFGPMVALVAVSNNLMKLLKIGDSGNLFVQPIGTLLGRLNLNPQDLQDIAQRLTG